MAYAIDLGLDKFCYYSKNVTIKTEMEPNYKRLTTHNKRLTPHIWVTTVYNEQTKEVVEQLESVTEDGARANFNHLKTKHILDYENIYTPSTSKESKDKGAYDFGKVRSSLSGWRG